MVRLLSIRRATHGESRRWRFASCSLPPGALPQAGIERAVGPCACAGHGIDLEGGDFSAKGAASYQPGATPQEAVSKTTRRANGPFQPGGNESDCHPIAMPQFMSSSARRIDFRILRNLCVLDSMLILRRWRAMPDVKPIASAAWRTTSISRFDCHAPSLSRTLSRN